MTHRRLRIPIIMIGAAGCLCGCSTDKRADPVRTVEAYGADRIQARLPVGQLLPPEIVKGDNYVIDDEVAVIDHMYLFTLRTPYGVIPALGRPMLELRLSEMEAIGRARELSEDPHVVEGVLDSFEKTGQGLGILLTDPLGALRRTPEGVSRMVKGTLDPADRRAGGEARRRLAVRLGCDPETRNPVLKKLLDEMSLRQGAGRLMTMPVGMFVPGMGLLKTTSEIKDLVANAPPHEINEEIGRELAAMGVDAKVKERFLTDMDYTTTQRLLFMRELRRVQDVEGFRTILEEAATVNNEAEALAAILRASLLANLHEKQPIERIVDAGMMTAVLKSGDHALVTAADRLMGTSDVERRIAEYRKRFPQAITVLLAAGDVSPEAGDLLRGAGMQIVEDGRLDW